MNMFQSTWSRHRPTSTFTPAVSITPREESNQIMGKDAPVIDATVIIDNATVITVTESSNVIAAGIVQSVRTPDPIAEKESTNIIVASIPKTPVKPSFNSVIDDVNKTLHSLDSASTESAYTYGIEKLRKAKGDLPDGLIVGHLFHPSYDLWIAEYNEEERIFYGFASFAGVHDDCAEWGYVSVDEILSISPFKVERDFYWKPCTLNKIMGEDEEPESDRGDAAMDAVIESQAEVIEPPSSPLDDCIFLIGAGEYKSVPGSTYSDGLTRWVPYIDPVLKEGDMPDVFFSTQDDRDTFVSSLDSTTPWVHISVTVMSFGKNVDKSTFEVETEINYSHSMERGTIYGVRYVTPKWANGFTKELADDFVKDHFKNNLGLTLDQLKDNYNQSGGGRPTSKPGIFVNYHSDNNGFHISMEGFQYCDDSKYTYSWKQVSDLINSKQEAMPLLIEDSGSSEIPTTHTDLSVAPFNPAEKPASKTSDISWFFEPGYTKYALGNRSSQRNDRLIGNMLDEHRDDLQSLWNGYSGKGGLHEVDYSECGNFAAYTQAKQEFELGEFYTPDNIAQQMVKILQIPASCKVIDSTCGMSRFFNFIPNENRLIGLDVDYTALDVSGKLFSDVRFGNRDVFDTKYFAEANAIQYSIGNPPFNLKENHNWHHPLATQTEEEEGGSGLLLSQNAYIYNTAQYLVNGGVAFFIVPQTWLQGLCHKKVAEFVSENFVMIAELSLDKKAFSEYGVEFETKAILMMKKSSDISFDMPMFSGSFDDIQSFLTSDQYEWYLTNKFEVDHSIAKAKLQTMKNSSNEKDRKFHKEQIVLKSIYETFRGKPMEITEDMTEAQLKPIVRNREMLKGEFAILETNRGSYRVFDMLMDRQAKRLNKAIAREARRTLQVEFQIARYDILLNRSNTTVTEYFNRPKNKIMVGDRLSFLEQKYSKNDLCTDDNKYKEFKNVLEYLVGNTFQLEYYGETRFITPVIQKGLIKYIDRMRELYRLNTMDTDKLSEAYPIAYEENVEMLSELEFGDKKLLPHQVEDLAGVLLKRNALISWDTGLGKTLGGITWSMVKGGTTLVIAPAVNTIDPWTQQIKEYRPDATFLLLKKSKDIYKYKGEDYLIVSFESLTSIYKQLASLKFRNLILDESDNAKSKSSKRFKSLRAIAKRFKNRLLMSGTPTRNNVNEIYNQIELLCQNSMSMICWAKGKIEYDRSSREWGTANNPHYSQPFPAWGGHKAFEDTFSPRKLTCFGAQETNQDIFNKEIFDKLMRSVRFTRVFDIEKPRINAILGMEDSGVYKEYKQIIVPMSKTEEKVYDYILTDLANQMQAYYTSLHDGATASMLVIMQQIMKLMQGTSHPWTFTGYEDDQGEYHKVYDLDHNTSTKLEKACEIIDETFKKEGHNKVMMASPWKHTDLQMSITFEARGYNVYRLTSDMTKHKRAAIVSAFRQFPGNAIICGTMGVLKSGLNLPEVNTVIAESYPWNFAQLHQYAARAIRLNSTEKTDIYCLTSEGSFDLNVFSLILRKEVANTFVRTSGETSVAELSKGFGVESTDLFEQAMQMVKEKTNGHTKGSIKWGNAAKLES